jgi:predicted TIM-barrel fold metal-dependent hydrolase
MSGHDDQRFTGLDRRALLAGLGGLLGCARVKLAGPFPVATACDPAVCTTVDVHAHVFNGSDLPISGFLTHQVPFGSQLLPVAVKLHEAVNGSCPNAAEELNESLSLFGLDRPVQPVVSAKVTEAVRAILKKTEGWASWNWLSGRDVRGTTERIADMFAFITRPRYQIAASCAQIYRTVDLFTPSLIDYDHWSSDEPETPFEQQVAVHERVAKLSIRGKIGRAKARFHPFTSFDPMREVRTAMAKGPYQPFGAGAPIDKVDPTKLPPLPPQVAGDWASDTTTIASGASALDIVRHSIERAGFVGVKVYPTVGYLPLRNDCWDVQARDGVGVKLDQVLRAFYAYCQAMEVPVMTHSSNSNGYALGYGLLVSPAAWAPVLKEFPKLRLNLGHFGHLEGWDDERGLRACEAWIRQAAVLMQKYENVYADVSSSALPVEAGFDARYLPILKDVMKEFPRTRLRLMYGSDFWVNRIEEQADFDVDAFADLLPKAKFDAAFVTGMMGSNALRFLGFLDEQGNKPTSPNRTRLQTFYGANEQPSWLR